MTILGQIIKSDIDIKEFSVVAIQDENDNFFHQWVIGTEATDEEKILEKLDQTPKEINKNYGVARNKALKAVKVQCMPANMIHDCLETKKKRGDKLRRQRS